MQIKQSKTFEQLSALHEEAKDEGRHNIRIIGVVKADDNMAVSATGSGEEIATMIMGLLLKHPEATNPLIDKLSANSEPENH